MKGSSSTHSGIPFDPPPSPSNDPFNPFLNNSRPARNPWEIVKFALMAPVFLIRLGLLLVGLISGLLLTHASLLGLRYSSRHQPLPRWRSNLLVAARLAFRLMLLGLGYNWIRTKGSRAKREVAPILVSNHVSFVDQIVLHVLDMPMVVSLKDTFDWPVTGTIMKAVQAIPVDPRSSVSRQQAANEVQRRLHCNDWPAILFFPEATTTNGRTVVAFHSGAFLPGLPVQPVALRYPFISADPCWVPLGERGRREVGWDAAKLMLRLMMEPHNCVVVEYLPVLHPSPRELLSPPLFAHRCRSSLASHLNLPLSPHSLADTLLAAEAHRLGMQPCHAVVGFHWFESRYEVKRGRATAWLRRFHRMQPDDDGDISPSSFASVLHLPDTSASHALFSFFDSNHRGSLSFREYLTGMAHVCASPAFPSVVSATLSLLGAAMGTGQLSCQVFQRSWRAMMPATSDEQMTAISRSAGFHSATQTMDRDGFEAFLRLFPEYAVLLSRWTPGCK